MRRLALREIEQHLVDIAPAPAFRRIVAFDHGMAGGMEMRGRVLVRGIVAAADMAAGAADAQVQPAAAGFQALLASERARRHVLDAGDVATALCGHGHSAGLAASPRKPCSAATTCAPSPIAPPTRLTDPERTSPTANTPGTVVSSCAAGRPFPCAGTPVSTKPPRSTLTPQPSSQVVAGSAPTNRKR